MEQSSKKKVNVFDEVFGHAICSCGLKGDVGQLVKHCEDEAKNGYKTGIHLWRDL